MSILGTEIASQRCRISGQLGRPKSSGVRLDADPVNLLQLRKRKADLRYFTSPTSTGRATCFSLLSEWNPVQSSGLDFGFRMKPSGRGWI